MVLDPGVSVKPGAVRVSWVTRVLDVPGQVRIWHIEFHSKYCELLGTSLVGGELMLYVWAGQHGIKLDESVPHDKATTIVLPLPDAGEWDVVADGSARYSMRAVAYRLPPEEVR